MNNSINASITATIKPTDIPVAPGVNISALKAGDPDPLEVVVEIVPGESTRGWIYQAEALKSIVMHVQEKTLNGFLGHQKPEDVPNEFRPPVTHWVGAIWKNEKAYFRGVVDAGASDLKRWIRAGRIKQVSIYGIPKIQVIGGKTYVQDYKPLSIDWTPLDRAGMNTNVVSTGEMYSNNTGLIKMRTDIHTGEKSYVSAAEDNMSSGEMNKPENTPDGLIIVKVNI